MPRIHKPKKDLLIVSVKGREEATIRDAYRLHLFALAEQMFPARFEDFRKTALPLYFRAETDASAEVGLDLEIARWARTLNLVEYPPDLPDWARPKRDLWVRELAAERLRAWHQTEPRVINFLIGGVGPNTVPRRTNETPAAWRKRIIKAKLHASAKRNVPEWERTLRFQDHFKWFVQRRVGKAALKSLARDGQSPQAVAEAIRSIATIVDPD